MKNFKKLNIWQLGMDIVEKVYEVIPCLPEDEKYGIRYQVTRCAVSIPANIAEGSAKTSQKDYLRYIEISLGSSFELETHFLIIKKRKWLSENLINDLLELIEKEQRMLQAFIKKF
jgi:four helix bundle protein